jgi:PAS domain S-box-containing protein
MSLTVRVIAPTGRDAEMVIALLRESGLRAEACSDPRPLLASDEPLGPLLLAEESLLPEVVAELSRVVRAQPDWSDFPNLILTGNGRDAMRTQWMEDVRVALGSPVLLDRPLRTATLVASVRAAVRARARQYQVRDALEERDRVLTELNAERERLRVILDSMPVGILVADTEGNVVLSNPVVERISGRRVPPRVPHPEWTVFSREGKRVSDAQLPLVRVLQSGTPVLSEEYQYDRADGRHVPVSIACSPIRDEYGAVSGAVVAIADLSLQKQSETALIQSEKLAAVGRLAASISHEINNPLEAITNLLYLMRVEGGLDSNAITYLSMAEQELARVSQIASQTLRFHRQSIAPRAVAPEELVTSVVALYQGRLMNSSIGVVHQHRGAELVTVYEGDIRQVLNNLVGNAIDAMRGGGRLVLRTRESHNWRTGEPGVRILVADTGQGMDAATRLRIFEAFYTTKGINGTGLGLWISKGIVDKHRGLLHVRSRSEGAATGTVFSLFLPRAATEAGTPDR